MGHCVVTQCSLVYFGISVISDIFDIMGSFPTFLLLVLLTWTAQQSLCKPAMTGGDYQYAKESGEYPEESGEYPEDSGEYPEESGEYPEESGEYHEESGEYPEDSGEYPEDSGEYPDESGEYPEEATTVIPKRFKRNPKGLGCCFTMRENCPRWQRQCDDWRG